MLTQLSFGALHVTRLVFGDIKLSVNNITAAPSRLTLLNIGLPGKDGEGLNNFTSNPVAYYILAKN